MLFYCKNFEEGGAIAIWKIEESIEQLLSYFSLLKVDAVSAKSWLEPVKLIKIAFLPTLRVLVKKSSADKMPS